MESITAKFFQVIEQPEMKVDNEKFLKILEATPLVSIDLIIRDEAGRVLLGKRLNRPAQGFWFVPGGRILKGESIAEALARIAKAELAVGLRSCVLSGAFDHFYPDNFLGKPGISTHYVVLAYKCELNDPKGIKPDSQHLDLRWWGVDDLLASSDVHQNTKAYFHRHLSSDAPATGVGRG